MKALFSPRQLAEAIGVSESSIKRWVDDGVIHATRTAGGHRRILLTEVVRFVRETQAAIVRPEILGLRGLDEVGERAPRRGDEGEALFEFLRTGAAAEARGLLTSLYLEGRSVAEIVDGPLRSAMERIGDLWVTEPSGIFWEHRATDIAIQAVGQLRFLFAAPRDAPVAIGGAPSGDPYILPTLCAATVLESVGMHAVNLGAETPLRVLREAAAAVRADLVWLSYSVVSDAAAASREAQKLVDALDVPLAIGGQAGASLELAPYERLQRGASMRELEAFARGLAARERTAERQAAEA